MPLARYFLYVGGVLLALLFVANAYLPNLAPVENSGPQLPVIHIHTERKGPERVVYDTSAPMIAPAPAANAEAGTPAQPAVADVSSGAREAFAQVRPVDPKMPEPKQAQPPRKKIAKRHTAPPVRMVDQQPQFGWFGPQERLW